MAGSSTDFIYKLVDSSQLDSDLTTVANAIRTKGGTSAQLAFPQGMADAIAAIPSGGVSVPHLDSVTEYTQAEDWTSDTLGNAQNFAEVYCNANDTTDRCLYICYIENNTASLTYRADYLMFQRVTSTFTVGANARNNWTNWIGGITSGRSFYLTAGTKITVIKFNMP